MEILGTIALCIAVVLGWRSGQKNPKWFWEDK